MKSIWTSKTFWVNAVTFLVALVTLVAGQDWVANYPQVVAILGMVSGVLNVILRSITSVPVSFK